MLEEEEKSRCARHQIVYRLGNRTVQTPSKKWNRALIAVCILRISKRIVRWTKLFTEFLLYKKVELARITLFYYDALNNVWRYLTCKQNQKAHVVWNIRNTNIERRQSYFQYISRYNFESLLIYLIWKTFWQARNHLLVLFDRRLSPRLSKQNPYDVFRRIYQIFGELPCSWTDLQNRLIFSNLDWRNYRINSK